MAGDGEDYAAAHRGSPLPTVGASDFDFPWLRSGDAHSLGIFGHSGRRADAVVCNLRGPSQRAKLTTIIPIGDRDDPPNADSVYWQRRGWRRHADLSRPHLPVQARQARKRRHWRLPARSQRLHVYNMRNLRDINGVYAQVRSGWAIGEQGRGKMWLQNSNGVYLKLQAHRQGLALSLGADGMVVRLGS
jgi:hypothetical protein